MAAPFLLSFNNHMILTCLYWGHWFKHAICLAYGRESSTVHAALVPFLTSRARGLLLTSRT